MSESFPRGGREVVKKRASSARIAPLFTTSAPKRQRSAAAPAAAAQRRDENEGGFDAEEVLSDLTPLMRAQVERRLEVRRAFTLTFPRLKVGMILMGSVREVRDVTRDGGCLLVALPNNLHGRVVRAATGEAAHSMLIAQRRSLDDVSAELGALSETYSVGQYVRCVVVGLDKVGNSRRVELSLRPSLVNNGVTRTTLEVGCVVSAEVKSEEDHGYIVSLGIAELTGFVPKKKAGDVPLRRGQVVDAAVAAVRADSGVVTLATDSRSVTTAVAPQSLALRSIKPGLLVRASIDKLLADGVLVSFLGSHFGTVDWSHLHDPFAAAAGSAATPKTGAQEKKKSKAPWHKQWRDVYNKTLPRPLIARVIHVDYESRSIGLSFAPHILVRRACGFEVAMGDVVEEAIVRRVDRDHGVLLELPAAAVADAAEDSDEDEEPKPKPRGAAAYVHISSIDDGTTTTLGKRFNVGTKHRCRVTDFNALEGIVSVSLKPSVVDAELVQYADAVPGLIVRGIVASVDGKVGAVVRLGDKLKGFVTPMHMSDVPALDARGHPLKEVKASGRFAIGAKIACRILSCDPTKKKLMLTAKKTLVRCKLPALATYTDLEPGSIAHGFVTGHNSAGIIVTFFDGVHGLVPITVLRRHLGVSKGAAPAAVAAHFRTGHLVKCAVKSVRFQEGSRPRLKLTLADSAALENIPRAPRKPLPPIGSIVSGVVREIDDVAAAETGLGALIISLPDGSSGFLAAHHLSDHTAHVAALHATLAHEGTAVEELLVLRHEHRRAVLTRKPLLVAAVRAAEAAAANDDVDAASNVLLPSKMEHVVVDSLIAAVVTNVTKFGVFVRSLGRFSAMAPRADVADEFVVDPSEHFSAGQTVLARVREVSHERQRIVISLRLSDVLPKPATKDAALSAASRAELLWLETLVSEQQLLGSGGETDWSVFAVGAVVQGVVQVVKEYGTVVQFLDTNGDGAIEDVTGFAISRHAGDAQRGDTVACRVLGVDAKKRVVDVSLLQSFVAAATATSTTASAKKKRKKSKRGKAASTEPAPLPQTNSRVKATIELVRASSYAVVSLNGRPGTFALAALSHFNGARQVPGLGSSSSMHALRALDSDVANSSAELTDMLAFSFMHKRTKRNAAEKEKGRQMEPSEVQIGMRLNGTVHKKHDDHAIIAVRGLKMSRVRARIHATASKSFQDYVQGQTVDVVVTSVKTRDGKLLLELTPWVGDGDGDGDAAADVAAAAAAISGDSVAAGTSIAGVIGEVRESGMWVLFSTTLRGWLPLLDVGDAKLLNRIANGKHFNLAAELDGSDSALASGQRIQCTSVRTDPRRGLLVSARTDAALRRPLRRGAVVIARIARIEEAWLVVQLPASLSSAKGGGSSAQLFGRICITELREREEWGSKPFGAFEEGGFVQCVVTKVAKDKKRSRSGPSPPIVDLSMRASLVADAVAGNFTPASAPQLNVDDIVTGYVAAISKKGCFVTIAQGVQARAQLKNLSDEFVDDIEAAFPPGKLVAGRIIEVRTIKGKGRVVELSMKPSVLVDSDTPRLRWTQLKVGLVLSGRVRKVESYGVFVTLDGSDMSGLCHKSNASDTRIKDLAAVYSQGDVVQVKILGLDQEKKKMQLGMKPSFFDGEEEVFSFGADGEAAEDEVAVAAMEEEEEESSSSDDDGEDEVPLKVASRAASSASSRASAQSSALAVDAGFAWGGMFGSAAAGASQGGGNKDEDDSEEEEEDVPQSKQHSSRRRQAELRKQEEQVREREEELIDGNAVPRSVEDFERLVVTHANSSLLWVKYIAFQLSCTEVAKARAVAARGLTMINFRLEQERMNVWVALLNLENRFGTQESLEDSFQRALRAMPQQPLYEQLLRIYEEDGKLDRASKLLKVMTRKFKSEQSVWLRYIGFVMRNSESSGALGGDGAGSLNKAAQRESAKLANLLSDGSKAKKALDRALQCLPKRDHMGMVIKFAQMEYKDGSAERGRTTFDEILAVYPKRIDVWNIFIDKEVQQMVAARGGDEGARDGEKAFASKREEVRRLFERLCHTKFSTKKMESLFKKYSTFEATHGTPEGRQRVLDLAAEYVEAVEQEALGLSK